MSRPALHRRVRRRRGPFTALAILASLVALAPAQGATAAGKSGNGLLAGRVAGAPVQCINVGLSNETMILDGEAIIYRVGRTLFVNRPANARSLDSDDLLVTNTTVSTQLCRNELVRLIDRAGLFQKGFVTLGDFVPYTRPAKTR